jgi:hypothetical protein
LTADYVAGSVSVKPLPLLTITRAGENVTVAWPTWAADFNLQAAEDGALSAGSWTNVTATLQTNGSDIQLTVPISGETKYFRLHRP